MVYRVINFGEKTILYYLRAVTFENSVDHDEMQHYALRLHCLQN